MAARTLFVTGTDTGVGKTHAACTLIRALRGAGFRVGAMKPVASGCEPTAQGLRNDDALALIEATGRPLAYADVNPYAFEPPIAPHLAAHRAGVEVDLGRLDAAWQRLAGDCEVLVVEGAGGWCVPLDAQRTFADWVSGHRWPVLLVVGLRLGCLNHALLSAESIAARTRLAGWIANRVPPEQVEWADNQATLDRLIAAPRVASLPTGPAPADAIAPATLAALLAAIGGHDDASVKVS